MVIKRSQAFGQSLQAQINSQHMRLERMAQELTNRIKLNDKNRNRKASSKVLVQVIILQKNAPLPLPSEFELDGFTRNSDAILGEIRLLREAALANEQAAKSCLAKTWEHSLNYLLKAEAFLGQAIAHTQVPGYESQLAKQKARLSHAESDRMRDQVVQHWRSEVDPSLSAEKAADKIVGTFHWDNGKEVAHRTLAKWIRLARKK